MHPLVEFDDKMRNQSRATFSVECTETEHKVSVTIATFTLVSVVIGSGMVAMPHLMVVDSISFSLVFYAFNLCCCFFSAHILMETAHACG